MESADFVEHVCSLVCEDVHKNLCVVQNNYREISNIVTSWSQDTCLDAFSSREKLRSYCIEELNVLHRYCTLKCSGMANPTKNTDCRPGVIIFYVSCMQLVGHWTYMVNIDRTISLFFIV